MAAYRWRESLGVMLYYTILCYTGPPLLKQMHVHVFTVCGHVTFVGAPSLPCIYTLYLHLFTYIDTNIFQVDMSFFFALCTMQQLESHCPNAMGCLKLVGSLKLQVSFVKEPYKRDDFLQKRLIILRSLPIEASPCPIFTCTFTCIFTYRITCIFAHMHS